MHRHYMVVDFGLLYLTRLACSSLPLHFTFSGALLGISLDFSVSFPLYTYVFNSLDSIFSRKCKLTAASGFFCYETWKK